MEISRSSPVWHPNTPGISGKEIWIEKGLGGYLYTKDGRKILDGISSWWVNTHGHSHPHIASAIARQAQELEHVIFAGFTHGPAEALASKLIQKAPGNMSRAFFSDNGSTAVEVAVKMALQHFVLKKQPRTRIAALRHGYHGDTFGAMALGERGSFSAAFKPLLFDVEFIEAPSVSLSQPYDPEAGKYLLRLAEEVLSQPNLAALVVEPGLQGAGGMRMFPDSWLDALFELARSFGVLIIADEVFTGFYRTGTLFATQRLRNRPDFICLSKGLTAGFLPMGLTLTHEQVAEPFFASDYEHTFYHGHSYTANPLACAAALAGLELMEHPDFEEKIQMIALLQESFTQKVHKDFPFMNARSSGTIFALQIQSKEGYAYNHPVRKNLYQWFLERDVLLRPLGNVIYTVPPYCLSAEELHYLQNQILVMLQNFEVNQNYPSTENPGLG